MKRTFIFSLIVILLLSACSFKRNPTEIVVDIELQREMGQLFNQLDFLGARALLQSKQKGLADVNILANYGYAEYKIFLDYKSSQRLLERALKLAPESADINMLMGEMFYSQGKYKDALTYLNTAAELYGAADGWNNELSKVNYLLAKAYRDQGDNTRAIASLEASIQYNPYRTEASMQLHQLYVEAMDYQRAYEVWKIENRIIEGTDHFLTRIQDCNELYQQALASGANHREWAELYSTLRLYDEAGIEYNRALGKNGQDPDVARELERIETFIEFRDELALFFEEYYRERSRGGDEFNDYQRLAPIYTKIAAYFDEDLGQSKSWIGKINGRIEQEYGVGLDFIMDSGVLFGLNFGYVVDDISTHVSQWGGTGEFRLIILKNMVSNGLMSWLSDGEGGVGGWNLGNNLMFAVQNSTGNILNTLDLLDKATADAFRRSAVEYDGILDNKKPGEVFYSKTLIHDLSAKQLSVEMQRAEENGIPVELRETYIIHRYQDSYLYTTIIVHEGQHALDKYFGNTWYGEDEYRAKLSELAYGDLQYRTLANLHSPALGTDIIDKHAEANTRVYNDIVQHILTNNSKYPEIDSTRNVMLQLPQLTEKQIKQIAIEVFEASYPDEKFK